jgi:hypothetical protein
MRMKILAHNITLQCSCYIMRNTETRHRQFVILVSYGLFVWLVADGWC